MVVGGLWVGETPMRANGALSCTRLEVSLRTSQKHLANNSAVLTKTQLLNKVSKHLLVINGGLETGRAFGVTPMRASPAKYNLAIPANSSPRSQGALRWRFYVLDGALAFG